MKSICFFILFSLTTFINCQGQSISNSTIKNTKKLFMKHYNAANYEQLFLLFEIDKSKKNNVKKLQSSLEKLRQIAGTIKEMDKINQSKNTYTYKTTLEKAVAETSFTFSKNGKLTSMSIQPNTSMKNEVILARNKTSFILPFKEEWYVFWGGSTISQNYHNAYPTMYGAFDFWVMGSNGKSHRTNGNVNTDYYAFGKEIIAPCDGRVVRVIKGIPDNVWPKMNNTVPLGNAIIIESANKEYLIFAHLKYKSIVVKEGQLVKQGETIGLCGNSGRSTEPHLHFCLQNSNDLISAKGAMSYFEKIYVNGKIKTDYSPVKGDKIRNNASK